MRVPRRAVLLPDKRIMQLAQLAPAGEGEGAVIRLLAEKLPKQTVRPPHRFADIVRPMPWEQAMRSERTPPPQFLAPLPPRSIPTPVTGRGSTPPTTARSSP